VKQGELDDAEAATDGLVATRNEKFEIVKPFLVQQAEEQYYARSGEEFIALENWKAAKENLESAREVLNEVEEDLPAI